MEYTVSIVIIPHEKRKRYHMEKNLRTKRNTTVSVLDDMIHYETKVIS